MTEEKMRKLFNIVPLILAIAGTSPVVAHSSKSVEWWLVVDDANVHVAHFVDMASIGRSDHGARINMMTLNRTGGREVRTLIVDCERALGAPGNDAVKQFICGTEEYRQSNGLILGAVSPDEMAAILFAGRSAQTDEDIRDIA